MQFFLFYSFNWAVKNWKCIQVLIDYNDNFAQEEAALLFLSCNIQKHRYILDILTAASQTAFWNFLRIREITRVNHCGIWRQKLSSQETN